MGNNSSKRCPALLYRYNKDSALTRKIVQVPGQFYSGRIVKLVWEPDQFDCQNLINLATQTITAIIPVMTAAQDQVLHLRGGCDPDELVFTGG